MTRRSEESIAQPPGQRSFLTPFHLHPVLQAAIALLGVSCILALFIGDIGFQGDDWWILSFPYWNSFPESVVAYAKVALRPVEGFYWISLFEIFGINRLPYVFFSLILNVFSSSLFALCLLRVHPNQHELALWAGLFSFLMPMSSPLLFIMHTDNSRLAMVFFWTSVLCVQSGLHNSHWRLFCAVICYLLSVLTYENASLLIFALPFFVVRAVKNGGVAIQTRPILKQITMVIVAGFLGFLGIRFFVFSGGAVNHASLVPSIALLSSYGTGLVAYLYAPLKNIGADPWSWLFGVSVGGIGLALLKQQGRSTIAPIAPLRNHNRAMVFLTGAGFVMFCLGIAPYVLAGYSASFGFTGQSRIYSSGSFGIAMILAAILTLGSSSRLVRRVMNLVGVLLLAIMAAFLCDLRKDWHEAAEIRKDLCKSLITRLPRVSDGTTLLFWDLQSYLGDRAVIFQGVDGLEQYVKMLYDNNTLRGFFLYSRQGNISGDTERTALITREGIFARGSAMYGPAPLDTIIILRNQGHDLSLVESVTCVEDSLDAQWVGASGIFSQTTRILPAGGRHGSQQKCLY